MFGPTKKTIELQASKYATSGKMSVAFVLESSLGVEALRFLYREREIKYNSI